MAMGGRGYTTTAFFWRIHEDSSCVDEVPYLPVMTVESQLLAIRTHHESRCIHLFLLFEFQIFFLAVKLRIGPCLFITISKGGKAERHLHPIYQRHWASYVFRSSQRCHPFHVSSSTPKNLDMMSVKGMKNQKDL